MPAPSAELEYLFRHGVMRDAAYQLLLPSERHALHRATALVLHENTPAAERDVIAAEIVDHATQALENGQDEDAHKLQHEYLRRAGQRCHDNRELERGLGFLQRLLEHPLTDRAKRLDTVNEVAGLLLSLGRVEEAESILKDALSRCGPGDESAKGRFHAGLAGVYMETGRVKEADDEFQAAIEIHREQNDRRYLGIALTNRAIHFRHTGQGESPRRLLEEALKIHREVGNRRFEGRTLLGLAGSYRTAEENEMAEALYLQAQKLFESINADFEAAQAWGNLANVYLTTDRLELAEEAYLQAYRVVREVGAQRSLGILSGNLSSLYWATGRLMLSIRLIRQAVDTLERLGDRIIAAAFRAQLGARLITMGYMHEADQQLQRAHEDASDIPGSIAMVDYVLPNLFKLNLARACGTYGPEGEPAKRDPAAFDDAESFLRQMRVTAKEGQQENTVSLTRRVSGDLKQFVQARKAVEEGREPGLYNGSDVRPQSPESRLAVIAHLKATAPDHYSYLQESNVALLEAMLEGTENLIEPDWRTDDLPS